MSNYNPVLIDNLVYENKSNTLLSNINGKWCITKPLNKNLYCVEFIMLV